MDKPTKKTTKKPVKKSDALPSLSFVAPDAVISKEVSVKKIRQYEVTLKREASDLPTRTPRMDRNPPPVKLNIDNERYTRVGYFVDEVTGVVVGFYILDRVTGQTFIIWVNESGTAWIV